MKATGPTARLRFTSLLWVAALAAMPGSAHAQAAREARLIVTVVDPTGAVLPGANVKVVGIDEATRKATVPPLKSSDKGVAIAEHLPPGRYSVTGEFPGFELGLLADIRVRAGDNKHVLVLPLAKVTAEVTVGRDPQLSAADRAGTFGTALTREQVESLSDDPNEMQRQLSEMAGPGAVMRVDSFEGQQLPPKAQIKSIHITRDAFAAENHSAGMLFVDIITQPGVGPLRGGVRMGLYNSALDGQNPLIPKKGPAQTRTFQGNVSGSIQKEKSSFSVSAGGSNGYTTPNLYADTPAGLAAQNLSRLQVPSSNFMVSGLFDYAVTKDQTLRVGIGRSSFSTKNQGVGGYDLIARAFTTENRNFVVRVQEAGPIGRRFFINTRFYVTQSSSSSRSAVEAQTIVVNDAFTSGGAQRAGGRNSLNLSLQSDLDYVRGIQSWRGGIQIDGNRTRSNDATNYLGTYTFSSLTAYEAGLPTTYTRRVGDPSIEYRNFQVGLYVQDDIRVSKGLTLSPGVRIEAQSLLHGDVNVGPRFGITWAPFKGGKTTLRASAGVFYDWLSTGIYEQTLRVNGYRLAELIISDPSYPDPGSLGTIPPGNRYLFGTDMQMSRNVRLSAGVDQQITKTFRAGATYAITRASSLLVGQNMNAPVDGVRPDPAFANVIAAMAGAESHAQSVSAYATLSVPSKGPSATGPLFDWTRGLALYGSYTLGRTGNNTDGAFSVPASNSLSTEWGHSSGDVRNRFSVTVTSTALKNFMANVSLYASTGSPYTIRTGYDNNGDLIFNDRPAGVDRNTVRATGQWNISGYFTYTIGLGKRTIPLPPGITISGGGPGGFTVSTGSAQSASRYRLGISASLNNLTNHANYVGYIGNQTSSFFLKPTSVAGVRRVDLSVNFTF